jgi:uncharacterized protein (DUF2249 family)
MHNTSRTDAVDTIDLRSIAPRYRHPLIVAKLDELRPGAHFVLLNDHDPALLFDLLQERAPGRYTWDSVESGPDIWRIRIGRLPRTSGDGQCCGGCGGA